MAIVANGYYNDPALASAFSNLASAFAPPSGSDIAGYATAAATKQKAARLAQLFNYASDPNFKQALFDRMGIAVGNYAPTQSYYSVDQANDTARRGQDITASTDLEKARITDAGDTTRAMLAPVASGSTRFVPPSIAGMYDVPEQQTGVVSVGQGDKAVLPDGSVINGQAKPLTMDQVKAAALQGLPVTDQQAAVLSDIPVEKVVVDGNSQFVRRSDAVGKTPDQASGANPETKNYKAPDGSLGTAILRGGQWYDSQTGEALPKGSILFSTSLQGGSAETGIGPTKSNQTDATRLEAESKFALQRVADFRDLLQKNPGVIGVPGMVRGFTQDVLAFADEMVQAYGKEVADNQGNFVFKSLGDVEKFANDLADKLEGSDGKRGYYDPNIRRAQALALEMAYINAKVNDPSGEVNVREMERNLNKFDGGLSGNKGVLASLDELERSLNERLKIQVNTLRSPDGQVPDGGASVPADANTTTINTPNGVVTVQRID